MFTKVAREVFFGRYEQHPESEYSYSKAIA